MKRTYWFQNLSGGMDQSTDSSLVVNNESPLLKNIVLGQAGNWASRKGTTRLDSDTPGAGEIWGLGAYNKSDGTHTFFRVKDRDLQKWTTSWGNTDADEWTDNKKVNMINYLDRLYLGCEDGTTTLAWCVAAGILTDITPTIGGHILAVNKSILAVAGNSIKPNVIFYSDPYTDIFHSATGTCAANADSGGANTVTTTTGIFEANMEGAVIYNTTDGVMHLITDWTDADTVTTDAATSTWDNDTVYILQNNFTIDGACTGTIGFQENFISFDEESLYVWDPTSKWSQKIPGFGCVNDRTVKIVDGSLIWVDREGVYFWDGTNRPIDITGKIRDKVDGYGIFDLINASNWDQLCAGSFEGKYYLSLGDLSTVSGAPASAMTNAELVFDVSKGSWTVTSRDDEPLVYSTYIDSGTKSLYYGEKTNMCIYKINSGVTDATSTGGTTTIATEARTPYFSLGKNPTVQKRISAYYVRYKSSGTVAVTQSVDKGAYTEVDALSVSTTETVVKILPKTETDGFSHSLKFVTSGTFTLMAIGFETEEVSFGNIAT